ncbi:PspC domain-containing protein [Tellurirhabdus rosea]|uniref:PspC domain-containing protein n=1 Tax=Tellurirhabdus rosea TaxID=2674997 RepID=UPI00225A1D92|nr:PspC domain-containing protein [Tellurirhabdus rosea]
MKKTISINISGVIFHIEEDGYDKLKNYLTSIQQYFSTYEDSQEIITDIENRIAEKLHNKLKTDQKGAVTLDDVNELIRSMGTVADFVAVEEEEILVGAGANSAKQAYGSEGARSGSNPAGTPPPPPNQTYSAPRKLYRDLRRKLLGGVASGIANYFNIDPVWVRLIFLTLFFALPPIGQEVGAGISGLTLILYIAMWVSFPGSVTLDDDKSVKKFYRNPDDKVLGGVASGLGAYFGIDPGVIRLLFVLTIFLFGTGLLAYLILWIISPEAKSMTEKMEMKGQPITLTNIEHNVKRSLNINETSGQESTLTKVLLFPFRLIAAVVNGLGRVLGPLLRGFGAVVRVFIGLLLIVTGGSIAIAALALLGVALGMQNVGIETGDFPIELLQQDISGPMLLAAFVAMFIPGLALGVLGATLVSRRAFFSRNIGLGMLALWFLSVLGLAIAIPPLVADFRRTGVVEQKSPLAIATVPTFILNDMDGGTSFRPSIELEGYDGTVMQVVKRLRSQGPSRQQAQQYASLAIYNFSVQDSTVRFDSEYELKPGSKFRGQDVDVTVLIPYEKPFRMDEEFARFIRNEFGQREIERMKTSLWKFTKADGLVNVGGARDLDRYENDDDFDTDDAVSQALRDEFGSDFDQRGEFSRQFNVGNFDKMNIGGAFVVRVRRGDTIKVVADGREEDLDDLRIEANGGELSVEFRDNSLFRLKDRKRIGLTITMPTIREAEFSGATQVSVAGFENVETLDLGLSGASKAQVDMKVRTLKLEVNGASKAFLRGRMENLDADLSGASELDATEAQVGKADVEASGASSADFGQVRDLNSRTSGASQVHGQEASQPMPQ